MVFRVLDRNSLKEREGWVKAVYNCGTHNFIPKIQFHDVCLKNYLGGVYMTPGRLSCQREFTSVPSHGST